MIRDFVNYCTDRFGYETVIRIKDFFLFLGGINIGIIIMLFASAKIYHRVKKVENPDGKVAFVEFKDGKKVHFYININSVYEAIEVMIMALFLRHTTKKRYGLHDEKRTLRLAKIIFSILIILTVISVILIFNPILPPM